MKKREKEQEWNDSIPKPEEERPAPCEETCRDGNGRNACRKEE